MEEALPRLPVALAVVLRLRRAGADDVLIAQALDIEPDGVETLVSLAEAKLRRAHGLLLEGGSQQPTNEATS
jgi:hypothetical protein